MITGVVARLRTLHLLSSALLLTLALTLSVAAKAQPNDDAARTAAALTSLTAEIAAIQALLEASEQERDSLQSALREIDTQISESDLQLDLLTNERAALQQQLDGLDAKSVGIRTAQKKRAEMIDASVQQLWLLHQGGGLRIWLGDQNPQLIARNLAFLKATIADQQIVLKEYEEGLAELTRNRDSIAATQETLQAQTERQTRLRQRLADQRENQRQILSQIDAQVKTEEERLAALSADRDRLNTLLIELSELTARAPAPRQAFETAKGRLEMPVAGEITNRFGSRRNTDMVWRGWLINASIGAPVRAIHPGQVIFSDWLRGQGLLVVIDHGEGWLSLYAHNDSLLRRVGEQVSASDVIARAGNSGGGEQSGLYFEIRQQGQPVDPADWIQR